MIFSDALIGRLNAVTIALDDPGTDLHTILGVLVGDLLMAVSSFLGLSVTVQLDGFPVTLTAIDPDLALVAAASLELPLARLPGVGTGGTVVFYAAHPGAFVDLAAAVERFQGPAGRVVLDGHLSSRFDPPHPVGIIGMAQLSFINRAVGVLITRGHTPVEARAALYRIAADRQSSVPDAARYVLNSISPDGEPQSRSLDQG